MDPGQTITPGNQKKPEPPKQPTEPPQKPATKPAQETPVSVDWKYNAEEAEATNESQEAYVQPVSWTASEYIAHQKGAGWFILVFLVIAGLAAIIFLLTRDVVSTAVISIIGIAFTTFAGRPPQTLQYSIDGTGLHIGLKSYPYDRFRSFAIIEDESVPTVMLIPLRRFDLPINIHFEEADAEKILTLLGNYLPAEEDAAPLVDRLMSKIRF